MTDKPAISTTTRREYVKYGGTVLAGGAMAGCVGGSSESDDDDSYTVTMSPMGEVEFDSVPESVYTGLPNTVDMAVAAGQADAVNAVYFPQYHGSLLDTFYDRLDGIDIEWDSLTDSWNLGTEGFYELDSDVHLTDPVYARTLDGLDESAVEEIREQVGPWFGNYYSDRHRSPPDSYDGDYQYYSLLDIFRNVAQVFRAGDRAEEFAAVHDSVRSTIESSLPPDSERPTVALTFKGQGDTFAVYRLNAEGFLTAHARPLGATDAFADITMEGAQKQVDYEAMVEADPDVVLVLFTMASSYSISDVRSTLEDDPVASEISAVQDGRVYAQGGRYQGPHLGVHDQVDSRLRDDCRWRHRRA